MRKRTLFKTGLTHALVGITVAATTLTAHAADKVYTLQDAYQAAVVTQEQVQIVEESRNQSEHRVDQAWTYLYPRLNAFGSYTRYNDTLPTSGGPVIFQPLDQVRAGLVLNQPLYTGGRTLAALRSAQKMRDSSTSALYQARQDAMMRAAEAYYGVIKAQKAIEINKRSLERMERYRRVAERDASTRKSKANQSSVLRAKSMVSQAGIGIIRAEDHLKVAREKLSLLTKLPLDAVYLEPQALAVPVESLDDLKKTALANRDDYIASKINQSVLEENVTIVRGGHYPQLYAEAGLTHQYSYPETMMDATTYYAGLRLQIPLFEGGLMKAEVAEAKSKLRQSELVTELMRRDIESQVHEAYVNIGTAAAIMQAAKQQVEYVRANYDAVEGLYSEGLAPSITVIDAQQALAFAEWELMIATYERQLAILRLWKSMGLLEKPKQESERGVHASS